MNNHIFLFRCEIIRRLYIVDYLIDQRQKKERSCWAKGVCDYASDLLAGLIDHYLNYESDNEKVYKFEEIREIALNGQKDWEGYSWNGLSLCYNYQIAERLCTPYELKTTKSGLRKPNAHEDWLDTQARALFQAWLLIINYWDKC